jgi:hypothetical protein
MSNIHERPHPGDLLSHAFELINQRGAEYNTTNTAADLEQHFREAAAVASVVLGKDLAPRDVAMILACVKLIRSKSSPGKLDNYVDGMNYLAFAACFQGLVPLPPLGAETAKKVVELKEVKDHA